MGEEKNTAMVEKVIDVIDDIKFIKISRFEITEHERSLIAKFYIRFRYKRDKRMYVEADVDIGAPIGNEILRNSLLEIAKFATNIAYGLKPIKWKLIMARSAMDKVMIRDMEIVSDIKKSIDRLFEHDRIITDSMQKAFATCRKFEMPVKESLKVMALVKRKYMISEVFDD
jgi:hypothetical protein